MEEGHDMQLDFPKALLYFLFLLTYSWFTMLCPSLLHRDAENKQTNKQTKKTKQKKREREFQKNNEKNVFICTIESLCCAAEVDKTL